MPHYKRLCSNQKLQHQKTATNDVLLPHCSILMFDDKQQKKSKKRDNPFDGNCDISNFLWQPAGQQHQQGNHQIDSFTQSFHSLNPSLLSATGAMNQITSNSNNNFNRSNPTPALKKRKLPSNYSSGTEFESIVDHGNNSCVLQQQPQITSSKILVNNNNKHIRINAISNRSLPIIPTISQNNTLTSTVGNHINVNNNNSPLIIYPTRGSVDHYNKMNSVDNQMKASNHVATPQQLDSVASTTTRVFSTGSGLSNSFLEEMSSSILSIVSGKVGDHNYCCVPTSTSKYSIEHTNELKLLTPATLNCTSQHCCAGNTIVLDSNCSSAPCKTTKSGQFQNNKNNGGPLAFNFFLDECNLDQDGCDVNSFGDHNNSMLLPNTNMFVRCHEMNQQQSKTVVQLPSIASLLQLERKC